MWSPTDGKFPLRPVRDPEDPPRSSLFSSYTTPDNRLRDQLDLPHLGHPVPRGRVVGTSVDTRGWSPRRKGPGSK